MASPTCRDNSGDKTVSCAAGQRRRLLSRTSTPSRRHLSVRRGGGRCQRRWQARPPTINLGDNTVSVLLGKRRWLLPTPAILRSRLRSSIRGPGGCQPADERPDLIVATSPDKHCQRACWETAGHLPDSAHLSCPAPALGSVAVADVNAMASSGTMLVANERDNTVSVLLGTESPSRAPHTHSPPVPVLPRWRWRTSTATVGPSCLWPTAMQHRQRVAGQ